MGKISSDEFKELIEKVVERGRLTYATISYENKGSDRTDNITIIRRCRALGHYTEQICQYPKDEVDRQEILKHCLGDLENLVKPLEIEPHKNFIKIIKPEEEK